MEYPLSLKLEEDWLTGIIEQRVAELKGGLILSATDLHCIPEPPEAGETFYGNFIKGNNLSVPERLLLGLCFFAAFKQQIFQSLYELAVSNNGTIPVQFGALFENNTVRIAPTLQTGIYLYSGNDDHRAMECYTILHQRNPLFVDGVLKLTAHASNNSFYPSFLVRIDTAYFNHFLYGKKIRLDEMENFPAQLLETNKTFDDLVLDDNVKQQLKAVMNYAKHYKTMHQKTNGQLQGYVTMFYGPPGTGKTMTASVIGKELGMDVYMVNLSRVISKYIGETEKNLEVVFDRLGNRDCILFFDEADALFGKRSEVTEANDRYANQEIAYLLQKIDACKCLVILATNFRQNLDVAFTRRILSTIKIDWPNEQERQLIWEKTLVVPFTYSPSNLPAILAGKYAISGSNINNIIKLGCYEALEKGTHELTFAMLEPFIKREYMKERRSPIDPLQWPAHQMN